MRDKPYDELIVEYEELIELVHALIDEWDDPESTLGDLGIKVNLLEDFIDDH